VSGTFVDTSAIYALLVSSDANHTRARRAFDRLRKEEATLTSSSYVLVESYALLGRRVGLEAVRTLRHEFTPLLEIIWINASLHERALDLLLDRDDAALSLVDASSFLVMRDRGIEEAFAYDRHFKREGFAVRS
jgi:predicted nucleic acid-binding protein